MVLAEHRTLSNVAHLLIRDSPLGASQKPNARASSSTSTCAHNNAVAVGTGSCGTSSRTETTPTFVMMLIVVVLMSSRRRCKRKHWRGTSARRCRPCRRGWDEAESSRAARKCY